MHLNSTDFLDAAIAVTKSAEMSMAGFVVSKSVIGDAIGVDYYTGFAAELTCMMGLTGGKPATNYASYYISWTTRHTIEFGRRDWEARRTAAILAPAAEKSPNSAEYIAGCVAATRVIERTVRWNYYLAGGNTTRDDDKIIRAALYKLFVAAVLIAREKRANALEFAAHTAASRPLFCPKLVPRRP